MARPSTNGKANNSGLNFEFRLWADADKMRAPMDASEYKHVVLGPIFLKYISAVYEEKREQLLLSSGDTKSDWCENHTLKGVQPRDYARPSLDKVRLGGRVDIISNIGFNQSAAKSKDVLGHAYEYFLGKFASAEGKGGGEITHRDKWLMGAVACKLLMEHCHV
ncbi:MAG: type I restriction-modification system subunit M N-terminal domain-containing protein [Verrucomicrobiota bacterium]